MVGVGRGRWAYVVSVNFLERSFGAHGRFGRVGSRLKMATPRLGCLKVQLLCLGGMDSRGVLGCLRDPLCHMSTVLGAGWVGGGSSPGAKGVLWPTVPGTCVL